MKKIINYINEYLTEIFIGILVLAVIVLVIIACIKDANRSDDLKSRAELNQIDTFDSTDIIMADENTGILYYKNTVTDNKYMCPYYSENGKLCRYEDGKIVEVEANEE